MSSTLDANSLIPESNLPLTNAAPTDTLRAVRNGKSVRVPIESLPPSAAVQAQIDVLTEGQQAGMLGFATKADMDADLAHPAGTLALVTNDPTPANNGAYRKEGASGTGSWVLSVDRVSGLEGRVSATEAVTEVVGPMVSAREVPGVVAAIEAADGSRTWLEANDEDGGPTGYAMEHIQRNIDGEAITQQVGIGFVDAPGILYALRDADGNLTDLAVEDETGQIMDFVIARWAARLAPLLNLPAAPEYHWPDVRGTASALKGGDVYVRGHEVLPVLPNALSWSGWGSSSMSQIATGMAALAGSFGASWYNGAKSGERAEHTLARLGSRPAMLTVDGGVIPASGSVTVTASNMPPSAAMLAFTGTLAGVAGTLSSTASTLTFTRTDSGDPVEVEDETAFLPDVGPLHRADVMLLWIGKNSLTGGVDGQTVAEQTFEAFAWLSPLVKRCIVLGHFVDTNTAANSTARGRIMACNAALAQTFGANYVDVHGWCTGPQIWADMGITPTADDLAQQALGNKPPSVSADNGHFNAAARQAICDHLIAPKLAELEWFS